MLGTTATTIARNVITDLKDYGVHQIAGAVLGIYYYRGLRKSGTEDKEACISAGICVSAGALFTSVVFGTYRALK